jgi:Tol biopolymer transport system component
MRGGTVGPVSDVYSLGAVLCLLLTGKTAAGDQLIELPAGLDPGLALVLQTAMQPDPEDRYRSVAAFADDLRACLDSRRIRARRRDWIYRAKRFARRQPVSAGLAGALLASLTVLGGLWYKQSQPASTLQNLTPARITSNTPELPIEAAAISPDGKVVAYTDSLGVHFHYPATGETRLLPQTSGHVLIHWTQDGSGLQTQALDADGRVTGAVISAVDGSVRNAGASDQYTMSPDGRRRARLAKNPERIVVEDKDGANARDLWIARELTVDQFVWSPDSSNVALLSSDPASSTLETIDVTSGRRTIRISPGMKLIIDALVWPNQDRLIVAVREQGRGVNSRGANNLWEVRLRDTDQGKLRRLTAWTDFPIRFASMTTDGRKLTFIRSFRQRDVYVAQVDPTRLRMGTPRRLTLDLGDDYPTAWTPDSKAVLFTSDRNGPSAIFRQALDKQTADQIVFGPSSQIIARAAAHGKWILFYGRDGAKRGIMRAPMGGGEAELLLESSNIIGLRCSRTGPCIISERRDGVVIVSEVDPLKGTRVREIYRDTSIRFAGPDLSPDAKWLATPSGATIVLRSFATGAIVREIAVQGASDAMNLVNLDYAADGKGFFAGQTTPTETRQLYVSLTGKTSVLWRQAGKSLLWGIPSPNGRYLAMMVYNDDSNVYTITDF